MDCVCGWKTTLHWESGFFLLVMLEERERGDDEQSLLQINNSYKWASLIWVMIERLLICLVADEIKEEGVGWKQGGWAWGIPGRIDEKDTQM